MELETVGLGAFFEDMPVGRRFRTIGRTVTETDLVNYINGLGLVEVLFTNQEFREKESDIKGRLIPAMLSHGLMEGLLVQSVMQHTAMALLQLELSVQGPAFVGDTLHVEVEVLEARLSKSRPHRGLVRSRNQVRKQDGSVVLTYHPLRMIKCRSAMA